MHWLHLSDNGTVSPRGIDVLEYPLLAIPEYIFPYSMVCVGS